MGTWESSGGRVNTLNVSVEGLDIQVKAEPQWSVSKLLEMAYNCLRLCFPIRLEVHAVDTTLLRVQWVSISTEITVTYFTCRNNTRPGLRK